MGGVGHRHGNGNGQTTHGGATASNGASTPGKHTQTEQLAAQVHQDMAEYADDPEAANLFLDPIDRARLMGLFGDNVGLCAMNWLGSILGEEIVEATKHPEGWNALLEMLFYFSANAVTDGAYAEILAMGRAAKTVAAIERIAPLVNRVDKVKGTMVQASRGARVWGRSELGKAEGRSDVAAVNKLDELKSVPPLWATNMRAAVHKGADDYMLIAMVHAADPNKVLTPAHFTEQTQKFLATWKAQVYEVGDSRAHVIETVAWIWPSGGGSPRLARVGAWRPPTTLEEGSGDNLRADVFREWVLDGLTQEAIGQAKAKRATCAGTTFLSGLSNAPKDAETLRWDRGSISAASETAEAPYRETSHEDPRTP